MARRLGDTWYVGVLNGKDEAQTVDIDWSFLGDGEWSVTTFADKGGEEKAWDIQADCKMTAGDMPAKIDMLPRGGYVAVLKK